jgi:hypothetical protein
LHEGGPSGAIKAASATLILAETCAAQPASPRPRAR